MPAHHRGFHVPPPRPASTPQSRRAHAAAAARLSDSLVSAVPGPGWYETDVVSFGKSSTSHVGDVHRKSWWALSASARLPEPTADEMGRAAPGEYAAKPALAAKVSATASPSVHAQRGCSWHSDASAARLIKLPFHQGVAPGSEFSPGPGAYNPIDPDACGASGGSAASRPGGSSKRGLSSTVFRSTTPQHGDPPPEANPGPGAYRVDGLSKVGAFTSRDGDASNLPFASRTERFPPTINSTSVSVGPGTYSPDVSEHRTKERGNGRGKLGAQSYPFSSTDRRYRKAPTGPSDADVPSF